MAGLALGFGLGLSLLVSACLGLALGVGLPNVVLQRRIARRIKKFVDAAARGASI